MATSKRGEGLLMRKMGILAPAAPVSSAAKGAFDAYFIGNLSPYQVEALDERFPATNHWAGGAVRPTANTVA
jgi:hypothetical protein